MSPHYVTVSWSSDESTRSTQSLQGAVVAGTTQSTKRWETVGAYGRCKVLERWGGEWRYVPVQELEGGGGVDWFVGRSGLLVEHWRGGLYEGESSKVVRV